MHEISIGAALVDAAIRTAEEERPRRISKIHIEVGELTGLNPDQLRHIFKTTTKKTIIADAELVIKTIKPAIECKECGYKGRVNLVKDFHFNTPQITCPTCKSREVKITAGNECRLYRITFRNRSDE
ncbi:hydrogenase nickel incorporation protein HypA [Candidatus Methanoperedenaceae archaeon GB50]|nr:hydrogenase nickel incorporation protein HypA [Candidatus Methanoperedenaceae archaeon GB50]CAD7780337.1 MAG: hydrogenase nickel incorporation protein HypA [Candidatus Methanoperedenaceae archaeon GB50]